MKEGLSSNFKWLLFGLFLALVYTFLFDFLRAEQFDSASYISGTQLLYGIEGGLDVQARISKPLALLFPGLIHNFLGVSIAVGYFIQNLLFFICLVYLVYSSYNQLYTDRQFARQNVWVYYSLPPFAIFSLFVLTDITGWFFIMLTIFAFGYFNKGIPTGKHYLIFGMIVGIGSLFKESALAGGVFVSVSILFFGGSIFEKISRMLLFSIPLLSFLTLGFLITQYYSGQSLFARQSLLFENYGLTRLYSFGNLPQVYRVFDLFWIPISMGLYKRVKNGLSSLDKTMLLSGVLILIAIPLAHADAIHDRILMMSAPFFLYFLPFGTFKRPLRTKILIAVFAVLNISAAFIIYRFDTSYILLANLILGLFLYCLFYFKEKRKLSIG
jgi:hypothetical protein